MRRCHCVPGLHAEHRPRTFSSVTRLPIEIEMELWLTGISFLGALVVAGWRGSEPAFGYVRRWARRVSTSPWTAAAGVAAVALVVYALPSLWRIPTPVVHDEFAYLLEGQTFAHGRLSNPAHPMSRFFETFHVLQSPTYAAKFPPGQGMMLALGYVIGLPIAGVWISLALACMAIHWMLRAVLPTRWATVLTLMAALHPTVLWFSQIYWGGGVSVLGGALLGGAVLRAIRIPTTRLGLIAGAGMGVLAISRPLEGFLFSAACGFALVILAFRDGQLRPLLLRFAPAATVVSSIAIGWLMYYDYRVTGKPLTLPYALHTSRYMSAPLLFWQEQPPMPAYPNDELRRFHTQTEYAEYLAQTGWPTSLTAALNRGGYVGWVYFRPILLLLPLGAALVAIRRHVSGRHVLTAVCVCLAVLLGHLCISPWMRAAYMSPLLGMLFVVIGVGMRQLDAWRFRGQPIGRPLMRAVVVSQIALAIAVLARTAIDNASSPISRRSQIVAQLEQRPGRHVVFVTYPPRHSMMQEWVYNAADIDGQTVIFARDLGPQANRTLLEYYPDRSPWLLAVQSSDATLCVMSNPPRDETTAIPSESIGP
jgi:hypothetical protein